MNRNYRICCVVLICILLICAGIVWGITQPETRISEDAVLVYQERRGEILRGVGGTEDE